MRKLATEKTAVTEKVSHNILFMLFTQGFDKTLEHFCMISVFSVDDSSHSAKPSSGQVAGYVV